MYAGDGWNYIAQRFDGNDGGFGEFLDTNLPLQGVNIEDVLSGHNALTGTITPEYPRLKGSDGKPILTEGGTAIWAEDPDGEIRGGGLLTYSGFNGDGEWALECTDITGVSIELPFEGGVNFVNVDPLDIFRYIWTHIQSQRGSNMGITIDSLGSPVRLGTDLIQRQEFDLEPDASEDLQPQPAPAAPPRYATNVLWRQAAVKAMSANGWNKEKVDDALKKWLQKDALTASGDWTALTEKERQIRDRAIERLGWPPNPPNPGPKKIEVVNVEFHLDPNDVDDEGPETPLTLEYDAYKLNWYSNFDLDSDISNLAADTPFDWHLTHRWDGNEIRHHIRLGYPRLGRRRPELRFVVGENIHTPPSVDRDGTDYATEVQVIGAGEGALAIRGRAFRVDETRVRKVITISDPSITTEIGAIRRAESELAKRFNIENVAEVQITDHPHAPMGSVDIGDEILVQGDIGWLEIDSWCRVVGRTMSPDDSDSQTLSLIRSDRIT